MGKLDDLEVLQKLRESGAITADEFEKVKKKILAENIEIIDSDNKNEIDEEQKIISDSIEKQETTTIVTNKVCSKCGNELLEEDKFCGKCGIAIKHMQIHLNTNEDEKTENKQKFFKVFCIICIIVALLFGSYLAINNSMKEKERENKDAEVFVPNLKEKTVSEAEQILKQLGVQYEFSTSNPGVDGKNFASTESDAIVKFQKINGNHILDDEKGRTVDKRYAKVVLTAMTQEMIDYKPKSSSLDNVEMNQLFTSTDEMNSTTQKVAQCALSYLYYYYPNFKWTNMQITQKDGYGRFWVVVHYVKSSSSERGDTAGIMVWIKDIYDSSKMGYYYSGSVFASSNGWGTPLPDNIGE